MPGKYRCNYLVQQIIVKDSKIQMTFGELNQVDSSSVVF